MTDTEKLTEISKTFNIVKFTIFDNGVFIDVGIRRPSNAPKMRRTASDRKRTIWSNTMNLYIVSHPLWPFKTVDIGLTVLLEGIQAKVYKKVINSQPQ